MRTAALRLCLSGFIVSAIPSLPLASIEYSAKIEEAGVFRSETLEPPPLATLGKGEGVKMIHQGENGSLIETEGGLKGWVRNEDLQAAKSAQGQKFKLGDQSVTGNGDLNISPLIFEYGSLQAELVPLDRTFSGEIVEAMDKEQVEMRHGEN
jgi:hypothetical protein